MTTARPVQEFFSIGEVCALTDLKPHVLRYWESQFRFLNPAKNRSGNRVYKAREVELIMLVKHLLYTEKYTIEGARQRLDQYRRSGELRAARARPRGAKWRADGARGVIDEVRELHGRAAHLAHGAAGQGSHRPADPPVRSEHPGHERRRHPRSRDSRSSPRCAARSGRSRWWRPTGSRAARRTRSRCIGRCGPRAAATARGRSMARPPTASCWRSRRLMPERPRLRVLRHQSRAEHGRGRAVLRHGVGGDGGGDPRHSGHRRLVRRQARDEATYRGAAGDAGAADHAAARISRATRCSTSTCPGSRPTRSGASGSTSSAAATSPNRSPG